MDMEQDAYEVITLDLWDTVIRRKCHPDEIKDKTSDYLLMNYYEYILREFRNVNALTQCRVQCEKEIGEKTRKKGLDDEYEIHTVFETLVQRLMPHYEGHQSLADELYAFELHTELENAYLDPEIAVLVDAIPHKQLAYLSDFYAGFEFIDTILSHIGCPLHFDKRYISCECGYNKRSGRLFEFAGNDLKIPSEKQLHIGDNPYSDVEMPRSKGIEAIHYLPEAECALRFQKEKRYEEAKASAHTGYQFAESDLKDDISLFFYGFLHWILESCLQDGTEEIYFFTREGEFFILFYDQIIETEYAGQKTPKSEILEVSRLSTFCPSLREISLTEMMRIWNQYSVQSPEALFKSLGISNELTVSFAEKYGLSLEEMITYPWQDERVIALFHDSDFVGMLEKQRDCKRQLLMEYLHRKGLPGGEKKKIAIVDIGWRGTIQDNISYLLPHCQIKGYYIGLIPFLNEQPANVTKRGYLNGYEKFELLLKYVMPFEMICNSPNGSTVNYEKKENTLYAVRKKEPEEDRVFYKYTEKIQKAVLTDIEKAGRKLAGQKYIASYLRETAHQKLSDYILYPQRIVAEAYFSLKHNEEFGVGEYVDKTTVFRWDLLFKACLGRRNRSKLAQFLRDTTWPQGYLAKYGLFWLIKRYNGRYPEG